MKKKHISLLLIISLLAGMLVGCANKEVKDNTAEQEIAVEESYPSKKINLIVPWPAGGIADRVARVYAPLLEKYIGQPVTVLNKDGASGAIGTEYAYSEPADGYNILFSVETPAVFKVMGTSDLGFENFDPIKMLIQDTKVMVVSKNSKYNTLEELISDIKENPGKIKMSYSGPGASGHLQGLLLQKLGLDVSMTPYGGGNPAMIATMGGEVDFTFANYGTVKDYIKVGDLKALSVFDTNGMEELEGVPAFTDIVEEANEYLPLYFPNVILVKEGTPENVKQAILEATNKVMEDEAWAEFVEKESYMRLDDLTPEEIKEYWENYTSIAAYLLFDSGSVTVNPEDLGIKRHK